MQRDWNHINELFTLRESLKKDLAEDNAYVPPIRIQDVDAAISKALLPLLSHMNGDLPNTSGEIDPAKVEQPKQGDTAEHDRAESIFDLIEFTEQHLTDSEFLAVTIELLFRLAKRPLTDDALAQRLGMERSAFVAAFVRGRDKLNSYWKERQNQRPVKPAA